MHSRKATLWLVAVLDGIEVESGVTFELGYARCLGKPIIGLKTDYQTFSKIEEINLILDVPILKICASVDEILSTRIGNTYLDLLKTYRRENVYQCCVESSTNYGKSNISCTSISHF